MKDTSGGARPQDWYGLPRTYPVGDELVVERVTPCPLTIGPVESSGAPREARPSRRGRA